MAIAGLILGVFGLTLCWVPFFGLILNVMGIVFSAVGMRKGPKGCAVPGLVFSIIGVVIAMIFSASVFGACMNELSGEMLLWQMLY